MNNINTEIFKTHKLDINKLVNFMDAKGVALETREVAQMLKVTMVFAAVLLAAANIQMSF